MSKAFLDARFLLLLIFCSTRLSTLFSTNAWMLPIINNRLLEEEKSSSLKGEELCLKKQTQPVVLSSANLSVQPCKRGRERKKEGVKQRFFQISADIKISLLEEERSGTDVSVVCSGSCFSGCDLLQMKCY